MVAERSVRSKRARRSKDESSKHERMIEAMIEVDTSSPGANHPLEIQTRGWGSC
jgi:hypothetical protein